MTALPKPPTIYAETARQNAGATVERARSELASADKIAEQLELLGSPAQSSSGDHNWTGGRKNT